jgi:hypothetical protein
MWSFIRLLISKFFLISHFIPYSHSHKHQELEFRFCCEHCDYKTKLSSHLKRHMRIHEADQGKIYKCNFCDYACNNSVSFMFIICDLNEWNNYLKNYMWMPIYLFYFILFYFPLYDRRIYVNMYLIARSMKDGLCMSAFTVQLMMKTCDLNAITWRSIINIYWIFIIFQKRLRMCFMHFTYLQLSIIFIYP